METCNGKGYLLRFYFLDDPPKSPIRDGPHPGSTQCSTFTEVYLVGRALYICKWGTYSDIESLSPDLMASSAGFLSFVLAPSTTAHASSTTVLSEKVL